jgi:hypothetical protein
LIELRINSGLCNRMRAMSSALALSRAARRPLRVYWFKTKALNCSYGELFQPIDGVEVVDVATGRLRAPFSPGARYLKAAGKRLPYDLFLNGAKLEELSKQGVDLAETVARAQRCGIETYGRFYGDPPYYQDFAPRPDLAAKAERTITAMLSEAAGRLIGVHIRRGDNDASIQVSPLSLFLERMEREASDDPHVRFFLATDDPDTERQVTSQFAGRVTSRDKDFSRTRATGVQDALVDLLILSRCALILGSYWSSFSQTAAELGGAELEVVRTPE